MSLRCLWDCSPTSIWSTIKVTICPKCRFWGWSILVCTAKHSVCLRLPCCASETSVYDFPGGTSTGVAILWECSVCSHGALIYAYGSPSCSSISTHGNYLRRMLLLVLTYLQAYYAEGLGSPALEYMICSCAARLVQSKELHRQPAKLWNLPESEIIHRNWLFWAIYCCEKAIINRSGRPSVNLSFDTHMLY